MRELILKLAIEKPFDGFPWGRSLKKSNIDISKGEVIGYLKELGINSYEFRKEFSWNVELAVYESAANYSTLEEVMQSTIARLEKFQCIHPYINNEIIMHILAHKGLNEEKNLEIFKKALKNTLMDKDKEDYKEVVTSWLIEIMAWNTMLRGFETTAEVSEEVFKLLEDKYSYLNVDREKIKICFTKLGIGLGKNIGTFVSVMKIDKDRYKALLMKENVDEKLEMSKVIKEEIVIEEKEEDITDSILGLFESMEEVEELKVEEKKVKKDTTKEKQKGKFESMIEKKSILSEVIPVIPVTENKEIANNEKEESNPCKTAGNGEDVYEKLAALTKILGYELVDENKVQISREFYEKLNSSKSEEEKVIKQLLSLEKGAVLSQLYNTYKNLNSTNIDNIEAVMSNFFSALFTMGFEVNEEEASIGEKITVNTKDLFKEFVFSKPVNKNGEINGQVQYLSWNYKDKIIMPKIVKPIE